MIKDVRGAVWNGEMLSLTRDLALRELGPGEARVRVLASGICHTDLNMMDDRLVPAPCVLGHEAAGIVEAIAPDVDGVTVGDRVLVSNQTPCGTCRECGRGMPANCDATWGFVPDYPFELHGLPVASFANCSSFAERINVKASQLVPSYDLPAPEAALIGCAVSTGFCGAQRLGRVRPGDTVLVLGVGGIGVNAIQGALQAGADRVVAADVNANKATIAERFGATGFIHVSREASGEDMAVQCRALAGAPIDVAVECSGASAAIEAAIRSPKQGGVSVLIGFGAKGAQATFPVREIVRGREIVAMMNGGAVPHDDYPRLVSLARNRQLDVRAQVTRTWPLERIEEAIAAVRSGAVVRGVVDYAL